MQWDLRILPLQHLILILILLCLSTPYSVLRVLIRNVAETLEDRGMAVPQNNDNLVTVRI